MGFYRAPQIVTNGLVLYLDAANPKSYPTTGTTWYDRSGNGNTGILTNGPTFNSSNNGSIVFDGVDDFTSITSSLTLGTSNTVSAFINLTSSNSDSVIYCPTANGVDNWLGISGNKIFLFATETSDVNNFTIIGTTTLINNGSVWYYVTSTINNNVATLYLNGKQENTITKSFTIASWSSVGDIGRRGGFSQTRFFKGNISQVSIYNRALTAQEILQNYNAIKSRYNL